MPGWPLGPVAAMAGFSWLADAPALVGRVMLFASGGILHMVFQNIAPRGSTRPPPRGEVPGFLLGLVEHGLTVG